MAAERAGDPTEAVRLLTDCAAEHPDAAEPWQRLAEVNARQGEFELALASAQRALSLDRANAMTPFRIAEWLTRLGRYDEAIPYFRRAVSLKPQWLEVGEILGRNLWFCHRHGEARREWRRWRDRQRRAARRAGHDPDAFRILAPAWTGWLGNNAHLDPYLKLRRLGRVSDVPLKVLAPPGRAANTHFLGYFEEHCEIVHDLDECRRLEALHSLLGDPLHTWFTDDDTPTYYLPAMAIAQGEWERAGRKPLLTLRDDDRSHLRDVLAQMGLSETDWYACLHVREAGFWKEQGQMWNAPRMAPVADYLPAIRRIVEAGGRVIRLGDPSMTPLPEMPGLIDYARSSFKSERMDVLLAGSCRFLLGTNSAMYWVSAAFGVPALITNWMPISAHPLQSSDRMVPKLLRARDDGRMLSFAAMLALPRDTWSGHYFDRHGLEVLDNAATDIESATVEMLAELGTPPSPSESDGPARLWHRYDARRQAARVPGAGRVSNAFLARHADLL